MNRMLTTTGFLSAATLVGLAGITQGQADATSSPGAPSPDAPMTCCIGGGMMGMMGGGGDSASTLTTRPVERVDVDAQQQAAVDRLTTAYLDVQTQLVQDNAEGVAGSFRQIRQSAQTLARADNDRLKNAAQRIAEVAAGRPDDLAAAREAFKPLSQAVIELAKLAPPTDEAAKTLYQAQCPMAKASWLQTSKEVANPYMGQSMPKCGSVQHAIKGEQR